METKNEENKNLRNRIKFGAIAGALIIAGLLAGWEGGIRIYPRYIRPYFSGMARRAAVDAYIKAQINDFTGGDTPEQTVDLFIEALKKGDYELASKYFVIDEQERWRKSFENPNKENIDNWIKELESNKNSWKKEVQAEDKIEFWYNIGIGENERTHSVFLKKNVNNKWKINHF